MSDEEDLATLLISMDEAQSAEFLALCVSSRTRVEGLSTVGQAARARRVIAEGARRRALKVWRKGGWHYPNQPEVPDSCGRRVYEAQLLKQIRCAVRILMADRRSD